MIKRLLILTIFVPLFGMSQFIENFDGDTEIPSGWTVLNGGDANTWNIIDFTPSASLSAHSGANTVSIGYDAVSHSDYLVTPPIVVTAGVSDYLVFWARSRDINYPEQISVMLSTTTPTDGAFTNTIAATVAPAGGASFYKYQYDLSAYIGQTIYIGFYSQTTDQFYFDLDDVQIKGVPSCIEPFFPEFSGITTQSAILSWTSASSSFEVEYGPLGFVLGSGTTVSSITSTTTTLNGLASNSTYDYYVRTNCDASGFSDWVGPVSFTTACEALTAFPFEEGFENGSIPDCWSQSSTIGSLPWTFVTANTDNSLTPRTGSYMAEFSNDDPATKTKLITPALDLTVIANPQLEFYYANLNWFGDVDELRIFYKTSYSGVWVQIGADYTEEQTTWTKVTLSLPNPSATYYIGFEATSKWARGLDLDDITVSATLSTADFDSQALRVYPNPTKDLLNISYNDAIKSVEVINLLGQKVMTVNVNANETAIDLTSLNAGTYIAKIITYDDAVKTVKVIKQ
ncbi:choice-of-anchor J domain-containing protein [Flavobacterium ardleyense]|uniref:Choice-of-anchor J domain-containing protein n=1 Tax=Flavobacterium ardleyense TaxID=2038737 RepID=A0ABW5Z5C8_9FLAO